MSTVPRPADSGRPAETNREGTRYGLAIFPQHAALLAASAIDPEVARERGYVSVDTLTRLESAGFAKRQQRKPGLLIPIHDVTGSVTRPRRCGSPRAPGRPTAR